MKIPKTTEDEPYIEFRFNSKGKLMKLRITEDYWGGINDGFISTWGYEGNTCLPKDLNKYIEAYKRRKIKEIEKEIKKLNVKLNSLKKKFE